MCRHGPDDVPVLPGTDEWLPEAGRFRCWNQGHGGDYSASLCGLPVFDPGRVLQEQLVVGVPRP